MIEDWSPSKCSAITVLQKASLTHFDEIVMRGVLRVLHYTQREFDGVVICASDAPSMATG
jgi:hypothetical protein